MDMSSTEHVINNSQPNLDCGLFGVQESSGISSGTEHILELINKIRSNNNILGLSNSINVLSPLSGEDSRDLSPSPSSNGCSMDNINGSSVVSSTCLASPSVIQQQLQQFQFDMAMAAFRQNNSRESMLAASCYSATPPIMFNTAKNEQNKARGVRKRAYTENNAASGPDECEPPKHSQQFSSSMEPPFAQFFPHNPSSDLLMAAVAATSASSSAPTSSSLPLMDWDHKQILALKRNFPAQKSGLATPTKKLRGIVTRADFMEKIEKAENLDDCKTIFLSILDVILPGKASQNVAVNIPMQNNFDTTRVGPKLVKISQDREEVDLHKLFTNFWLSKSHLSVKNIPSAFTRFVLSKVLGDEISKYTYCKLNNGKRGYKQLSNEFVKAITEFVAEGFGIPERDTSSRISLRNAVENVIINTCGNARKRVPGI